MRILLNLPSLCGTAINLTALTAETHIVSGVDRGQTETHHTILLLCQSLW